MPAIALIPAIIGSFFYGIVVGVGWFAIYLLRGAPGATGMEILGVPVLIVQALLAGTGAAVISYLLPRLDFAICDNPFLLTGGAVILQVAVSWFANVLKQGDLSPGLLWSL